MNNVPTYVDRLKATLGAHQFVVMLVGSIIIAIGMVSVALLAYEKSDASRLDLSHPDYQQVRSQITTEKPSGLLGTGPMTEEFLTEFEEKYKDQARHATDVDAFSGDVLSDEALGISQ